MQIARRRGIKKAIVALARRLAVIMHRIWVDGTEFRWTREQAVAAHSRAKAYRTIPDDLSTALNETVAVDRAPQPALSLLLIPFYLRPLLQNRVQ